MEYEVRTHVLTHYQPAARVDDAFHAATPYANPRTPQASYSAEISFPVWSGIKEAATRPMTEQAAI